MSVPSVKARLQLLLEALPGVRAVYTQSLRNTAEFPSFVITTGPATYERLESDMTTIRRAYRLLLLVKPAELGVQLEAEEASEPFYALMSDLLQERPGLWITTPNNTVDGVLDAGLLSDTGLVARSLAGVDWLGVEWELEVLELENIQQGG
jgi:hypothetical protein